MHLPPAVLHLVRTACIVESRSDRYAGYLASVFRHRGWEARFERWGAEEGTHGQSLRAWLAKEDPPFDFDTCMTRYLATVLYHEEDGRSVYGSEQAELVARCFVEAMAATYYQAVGAGAQGSPSLQALCHKLAADEARHYTMFRRLLEELRREEGMRRLEAMRVVWRRLWALDDEQILYASYVVSGTHEPFVLTNESRKYRAMVMSLYRPVHVRFVGTLVAQVFGLPPPPQSMDVLSGAALRVLRPIGVPRFATGSASPLPNLGKRV
ncbi:ferritin-like domain-containing protein [Archangium gephyra]|nr:ferritin-like domain-containing protein [Archangium gephyra]